ncbi:MAG TPA: ATP-binding protein [Thermoanaerobaculaceae bacterium]|nr:ATP-binding protein [Thermoanaerobaculaceae bacterium]
MDVRDDRAPVSLDSAHFVLPRRGWLKLHEHRGRSAVLALAGVIAVSAGLIGAERRVSEFQRLDFRTMRADRSYVVLSVGLRSGAARAGLAPGDEIVAIDGVPAASVDDLERALYSRRISTLSVVREGKARDVAYYPPVPQVDVRYLLVAFAAMFTLAVAGVVYLGHPTAHAGRFLALAEALFPAVVVPFPLEPDTSWQLLLLIRDFGRLALPPLLVVFFASFPARIRRFSWLWLAFVPSLAVAAGKTALAAGLLPPVVGDVMLPDAFDTATAVLAIVGVVAAAGLSVRTYVSYRSDPTRRRQVEWVALGAAAGFAPYLLLSLIPQLAGAEFEVLTWISLLPLALVPLGVASSLLEFRLWDLEDITRQVVATGVAVLLGGVSFAFLNYAITQFGFRLGNWRNLVAVAGGVLLATLTVPARRLLLEALERLQYRERLTARRALTTFAEEAVAHRDPETLLLRLSQLLRDALAIERVVTYLALGGRLYPSGAADRWPVLALDDVRGPFPTEAEAEFPGRGLWHRFPVERDGRVIGLVYCGRRRGELPLGHGERRLVGALAAQAALALENTLLMANLRRQVEEHRLLEDYLERIFQFSAAALLICDTSGRVLRANERAATLLHREPANLVGEFLHRLVELRTEWRGVLPADLAGVQVRFATGKEWHTCLVSTSALEVEPGRFDGRVVVLDDITEQLKLEQRLSEQERLASLGRLAAGLAHEVNTPVTGIASYAQLLRELTPTSDPRSPLALKLEEQAFRVSRIVTNLLELARPSGFERQLVDLSLLAREEIGQLRAEADRAGVTLEIAPAEELTASVNRVQFELVVHNLLRNALQATPRGGRVEVRVGSDDGRVWLEVRDTGPGVPEELRERIFEPFVTSRQGRGGTGLGLAITRDIVVAHGGSIRALENEGGGTAMRIEVPIQQENE